MCEIWDLEAFFFLDTSIFFEQHIYKECKIMTLKMDKKKYSVKRDELNGLLATEVSKETIYPLVCDDLSVCSFIPGEDHYIKGPGLSLFDPNDEHQLPVAELLLQEARIYEKLKMEPHPNIATYWGCIVAGGRITGLCLTRYEETLFDRLDPNLDTLERRPLDRSKCLKDIRSGLSHLHHLGLVHNDLRADNIMLGKDDTAVITDFDSCIPNGQPLGLKGGIAAECNPGVITSSFENDDVGEAEHEKGRTNI